MDTLNVRYFDDTPCSDCNASLTIKSEKGTPLKTIRNHNSNYDFNIKTTELQVLGFKNQSAVLKFYYKEDESENESLLFEIVIK